MICYIRRDLTNQFFERSQVIAIFLKLVIIDLLVGKGIYEILQIWSNA